MPKINEILEKKKNFKKREYRPWNIEGSESEKNTTQEPHNPHTAHIDANLNDQSEQLILIDPDEITNWEFHDRPESELGDIDALAKEFQKIGQQQPCIVRITEKHKNKKYELIIGERRWRAAKEAGMLVKAIVRELNDSEAALAQAAENDNRKDLSDFAKGMSFHKLIEQGVLKQKDLISRLGKSKQYISTLLSFGKIPEEILRAIGDMSNVSARTAEKIKQLCSKNPENIDKIKHLSEKIRDGRIGWQKLEEALNKENTYGKRPKKASEKYIVNGMHTGTMRPDNNKLWAYHFPKNVLEAFYEKGLSAKEIGEKISELIYEDLKR